ncbi:hypothetical protein GEMRC1_005287 [Eukaryota sp. GEM-RC1]
MSLVINSFAPQPLLMVIKEGQKSDKNRLFGGLFKKKVETKPTDDTVHVFSLASGFTYERLVKIMSLSVVKSTKHPVKIWLLGTYLSPQFRSDFPILASNLGFSYEFIDYRWPSWLLEQSSKHRVMWANKILFLDVLFPLSVDRVMFMDSDQVARADVKDIFFTDMGQAVYGMTPFCDDREDMKGYAFWRDENGWWYRHLKGKKYHISALFVVNLQKFREVKAGDVLRSVYHRLAQDPNSLSNLDQDLPNFMNGEGSLEIFSLPQDTLACDSWCSPESMKKAKVIDLCNNPQTKESKIDSALRVISEWITLDKEVKQLEVDVNRFNEEL